MKRANSNSSCISHYVLELNEISGEIIRQDILCTIYRQVSECRSSRWNGWELLCTVFFAFSNHKLMKKINDIILKFQKVSHIIKKTI